MKEMALTYKIIKISILVILTVILMACDSSDEIPVQQVTEHKLLSDKELQQHNNQKRANQQQDNQPHEHDVYYFGFDLRGSPQEDAAQYLPFLTYLQQATGLKFKLHFTPKNSTTYDELGRNITQFAAMGANGFLRAQQKYGAKSLVRGLNMDGKAEYQSVFVVRPGSDIRDINDINGRSMAFGSKDSTQGHLIPRIILNENNIALTDLAQYDYTGSHQNCAEAVVSGKFDVCGMQDKLGKSLAEQGMVKILLMSPYYPSSGIAVNKSVPDDVVARVRQAMVDFEPRGKHSSNLYNWDKTEMPLGFIVANDEEYDDLRHWSVKFGFLPSADTPKTE